MLSEDARAAEFQALYERVYGEPISLDRAREMVRRLLPLYDLLLRRSDATGCPGNDPSVAQITRDK